MSSDDLNIQATADGLVLDVKVVPGSSRDQIVGVLGGALKVKVAAPPEDGKANRAVCELLAAVLGVAKNQVRVIAGASRARKRIAVSGIGIQQMSERLASHP